ncbi:hypothetical protein GQ43DRAFT_73084 [Delitschia confertaspora ATCC 74209]|uniref:ABM domain-containing protein n=1 Tax=Delitschia confertaspora ATCC 74209 TaxID=1513339 RepID=A0A9P4JJV6_9PLEO|nr:hypothetical protein GQ43DRAFT_73084 [Delitschia confertaspora ATCC 74209]
MPILEVCELRLRKGVSVSDPKLLKNLQYVRSQLGTNSQFYQCIVDPALIYILGLWPSLDAHNAFLASPEKQRVLGPQEDQMEFQWAVHVELDAVESLPLDAPVMAIARVFISHGGTNTYRKENDGAIAKQVSNIFEATKPYKATYGWRLDAEQGSSEVLVFSGWESAEAYATYTLRAGWETEYAELRDQCVGIQVHHGRNIER